MLGASRLACGHRSPASSAEGQGAARVGDGDLDYVAEGGLLMCPAPCVNFGTGGRVSGKSGGRSSKEESIIALQKITVAAVALMTACSMGHAGPPTTDPRQTALGSRERGLRVEVQNQNFYDVTIYAYRGGSRTRLGTVSTNHTEFFTFDWSLTEVRFLVDFLSAGCLLTASLPVHEDEELLLILQSSDHRRASQRTCRP